MRMRDVGIILRRLYSDRRDDLSYMSDEVLAFNGKTLVWWCKPSKRHIWFNCRDESLLRDRHGTVPHPGLVFSVGPGGWSVWAVKGASRPEPGTVLYQAPYGNVYETGSICVGNVVLPKVLAPSSVEDLNNAFFGSRFTHANVHESKKLTRAKGGYEALWAGLLDEPTQRFPASTLVRTRETLGSMLTKLNDKAAK